MPDIDQLVERLKSMAETATIKYAPTQLLADMVNSGRTELGLSGEHVLTLIAEWRAQKAEIEKLRGRVGEMQHYAKRAIENPDQPEGRERAFRTIDEIARKALETD